MNKDTIRNIANEILSFKTMKLEELVEHPFAKIAMSTGELIFRTSQKSIKYAKGCVATSKRNDPRNGRWTFSVKCHQNWSKGPYDVRFRLLKEKGLKTQGILGREIEVSCNCNAWKYNGADVNALQNDYSERQYSNGQPANIRDPQKRYLICKHVAACVPLFKRFLIPNEFKNLTKLPVKKIIPQQPTKQQPQQKSIEKQPVKKQPITQKPTLNRQPEQQKQPIKPTRIKPIRNI
jgi:hypothetical protein